MSLSTVHHNDNGTLEKLITFPPGVTVPTDSQAATPIYLPAGHFNQPQLSFLNVNELQPAFTTAYVHKT